MAFISKPRTLPKRIRLEWDEDENFVPLAAEVVPDGFVITSRGKKRAHIAAQTARFLADLSDMLADPFYDE